MRASLDKIFMPRDLSRLSCQNLKKDNKSGKKFVTQFNREAVINSHRRKESKKALKNLVRQDVEENRKSRSSSVNSGRN